MVQDAHKPHHHVEHVHREGVKDHRKERDCPGDEDNVEYPDPVLEPFQVTPAPPPKPPKPV